MVSVNWSSPTDESIHYIASHLREADRIEIQAVNPKPVAEIVQDSVNVSTLCKVVSIDGVPSLVYGLVPLSILGSVAAPWLLATDAIEKILTDATPSLGLTSMARRWGLLTPWRLGFSGRPPIALPGCITLKAKRWWRWGMAALSMI